MSNFFSPAVANNVSASPASVNPYAAQQDPSLPAFARREPHPQVAGRPPRASPADLQRPSNPRPLHSSTSLPSLKTPSGSSRQYIAANFAAPASSNSHAQRFLPPGLASLTTEQLALRPKDRLNALLNKPPTISTSPPPSGPLPPVPPSSQAFAGVAHSTSHSASASADSASLASDALLSRSVSASSLTTSVPVPPPDVALGSSFATMDPKANAPNSSAAAPTGSLHSPHSSSSSTSTNLSAQPSVATLIANSGSAEAAIEKLLQDQRAQSTRSEQLWRLVEKQRSMLLGLNKDLERALKDKERYRKKLKELQAGSISTLPDQVVVLPSSSQPPASAVTINSKDSALLTARGDAAKQERTGVEPPAERADSKLSTRTDQSNPTSRSTAISFAPRPDLPNPETIFRTTTASATSPTTPVDSKGRGSISSPGEKRRHAPAPLDLTNAKPRPSITSLGRKSEEAIDDDSASDYDTRLSDKPSPARDRGRRKTREDDDRAREAFLDAEDAEEEDMRQSRSSKRSKSKSKIKSKSQEPSSQQAQRSTTFEAIRPPPTVADSGLPSGLGFGLPNSPRAPMLGGLQSPLGVNMGSIADTLAPAQPQQVSALLPKSPGLPMSPRPGDRPFNAPIPRMPKEPLMSPGPMSPRSGLPLSPRAPRGPIPMPMSANPLAVSTPYLQYQEQASQNGPAVSLAERLDQPSTQRSPHHSPKQSHTSGDGLVRSNSTVNKPGDVYRGFITDAYPSLLLPPNALPLVDVKVNSSRLRPSRQAAVGKGGDDESIITLAIHARADKQQLWRVEKSLTSLNVLHAQLKSAIDIQAKLPDKKAFASHAPAHVDARRLALDEYFKTVLDTPMDDSNALMVSQFLSTNVIGSKANQSPTITQTDVPEVTLILPEKPQRKEGYLAKKGKQFGGWKSRYFVLEESQLRYFESPSGSMLGYIKLHKAQIAKQNPKDTDEDAEFRHAFMVLERRRRDSSSLIRHVLCAESDEERDEWVDALMIHIGDEQAALMAEPGSPRSPTIPYKSYDDVKSRGQDENADRLVQAVSYDSLEASEPPSGSLYKTSSTPSPTSLSAQPGGLYPTISGPVGGGPIQNVLAWGNKPSPSLSKEQKKRSVFGFMSRASDETPGTPRNGRGHSASRPERRMPTRPIFGIPLAEAADICAPIGIDICLPAPVYRAVEYLEAKRAFLEEGIFRLSGSNLTVKSLRERFNTEGDIKLLEGPYYDIHAVAGLLKLYLRELPETVLTKELHLDFLKVLDLEDKPSKVAAVNVLVHKLPEPNHELLATLSRFLIEVVSNSEINKMNVRNVGIVFAPTLNIPAPLISLFLSDYESIFAADTSGDTASTASPVLESIATPSPASEMDIRSPRKQMFTDLATPSFNQTSFGPQQTQQVDRTAYDTGFAPMAQQEAAAFHQPARQYNIMTQMNADSYGSLNAAMSRPTTAPHGHAPTDSNASDKSLKKSRRESSLMGTSYKPADGANAYLGINNPNGSEQSLDGKRKSSYQRLREMAGASQLKDIREFD